MSRPAQDLTGRHFGQLVVKQRAENIGNHTAWYCRCECGGYTTVRAQSLLHRQGTKSCGCLRRSVAQERMRNYRLARAGQKRYRPVDEVVAEVIRNSLDRLAVLAAQALKRHRDEVRP